MLENNTAMSDTELNLSFHPNHIHLDPRRKYIGNIKHATQERNKTKHNYVPNTLVDPSSWIRFEAFIMQTLL